MKAQDPCGRARADFLLAPLDRWGIWCKLGGWMYRTKDSDSFLDLGGECDRDDVYLRTGSQATWIGKRADPDLILSAVSELQALAVDELGRPFPLLPDGRILTARVGPEGDIWWASGPELLGRLGGLHRLIGEMRQT